MQASCTQSRGQSRGQSRSQSRSQPQHRSDEIPPSSKGENPGRERPQRDYVRKPAASAFRFLDRACGNLQTCAVLMHNSGDRLFTKCLLQTSTSPQGGEFRASAPAKHARGSNRLC